MKRKILRLLVTLTLALSLCLLVASPAYAVHTVTPGASVDIDADENGGAYTALNNIVFTDLPGTDLANGNTFYLTAPTGFEFNPAVGTAIGATYGTLQIDLGGGAGVAAAPAYTVSDTVATWTVTAAGTGTVGAITISGMTIRPAVGTTTITGDGTANVTIASPDTTFNTANAHPIDHVPGAHAAYTVVTENAGTEVAGVGFTITLEAVDQHGNVNDDGANIVAGAIVITWTSTATNAPDGTPPTPIADGAQTFTAGAVTTGTDWTLTNAGETPTITATSAGPLTGTSAAITVNPDAVATLTVEVQPSAAVAGVAIAPPVQVKAVDAFTNIIAGESVAATLQTGTGVLSGTTPQVTAGTGIATFNDLSINLIGTDKVLRFTAAAIIVDSAPAFAITMGTATQLVFTTQPAGSVSGAALTTQPVVEAQDQYGNTDTTYVTNVVAATNDFGGLTGTTTQTPVAGVATFTDLVYTATGDETFQIDVTSGALTRATSNDVISAVTTPHEWGGPPPAPAVVTVTETGSVDLTAYIDNEGNTTAQIDLTSTDGQVIMTIPSGTRMLDAQGNPLDSIEIILLSTPPPPPGYTLVGPAYDCLPDGATFEPAFPLTFTYATADIPDGVSEEDLVLAYWVDDTWAMLATTVDTVANTVTANVAHFTPFAILAELPEAPATFVTSDLSITPAEVETNEAVTISVSVANTSGMEGSYTVVLMINGVTEAEESVTIAAGDSQSASFSVTKEDTGSYSIAIDDLSGTFVVTGATPPPASPTAVNWGLIGGIIAGVIIVGIITWRVVSSRRS